jgi:enoyl-CoA hydratase
MEYENIIYEKEDSIVRIVLNRPEKMNALSLALQHDLISGITEAEQDDDVKVIILKGAGRCFATGYDLSEVGFMYGMKEPKPGEKTRVKPSQRIRLQKDRFMFYEVYNHILLCPKLTIAQVHGYCIGGALTLAQHCDFIIASQDCKFGHVEERMGFAGATLSPMLILRVGLTRALDLCITGKMIGAKKAYEIGLINRVIPSDQLDKEVEEFASALARFPKDGIRLGKTKRHMVYDMMGITSEFAPAYAMHSFGTNITFEPDELNFFKERRDKGARMAAHSKHDFYKALDK